MGGTTNDDLETAIRSLVAEEFGRDARVEIVDDGRRVDVRVEPRQVIEELERQGGVDSVSPYSEFRFTLRRE